MLDFPLSPYGRASVNPSPVARMMAAVAADHRPGVDINLGVGYVNADTFPVEEIARETAYVLSHPDEHPMALNYGAAGGSVNLHRAIRRFLAEGRIGGLDEETLDRNAIAVGANGATSILDAIAQVIEPGIVITADPWYYIYCDILERLGYEILAVPQDGHGIQTDLLAEAVEALGARRRDIRFIYLVTVDNPTGTILADGRKRAVVEIADALSDGLGRAVPVIFDGAYDLLVHDPGAALPASGLVSDRRGIVYEIGTLSKVFAPALRIGWLLGPDGPLFRAVVQKTSDAGFSAPLLTQEVASRLLDGHFHAQLDRVRAAYRERAILTRGWIDGRLGTDITNLRGGGAGFYYYLTFKSIRTGEDSPLLRFCTRVTGDTAVDGPAGERHPRVVYIPGNFCVQLGGTLAEEGSRSLRISYGFEAPARIRQAIDIIADGVRYAERNPKSPRINTDKNS